jgi:hypothetical protein
MNHYISITGLKPKNFISTFRFWSLAIPCFRLAQKSKGNVFCETKKISGFQCTLTAWETKEDMLRFVHSEMHLKAMRAFNSIATGRTYGQECEAIPNWEEAFQMLQEKGKEYN